MGLDFEQFLFSVVHRITRSKIKWDAQNDRAKTGDETRISPQISRGHFFLSLYFASLRMRYWLEEIGTEFSELTDRWFKVI